MASICEFRMLIKGSIEGKKKFIDALEQRGQIYMGRGASVDEKEEYSNETYLHGTVKWSVKASLIDDAKEMRDNPSRWYFGGDVDKESLTFLTLWEACEQFGVNMEVFSKEEELNVEEHMKYENGEITEECDTDSWNFDLKGTQTIRLGDSQTTKIMNQIRELSEELLSYCSGSCDNLTDAEQELLEECAKTVEVISAFQ